MDRDLIKQLEDKKAMNQASKSMSHRVAVAEQIGHAGLIRSCKLLYHRKPSLIKRILGIK